MNKVITINLNGNAFQLEEQGYEVLRAYLERADTQLKDNPDKTEIIADLEQAIAEKCNGYLRPHKTVVTAAEVEQVVKDMGPVDDGGSEEAGQPTGSAPPADAPARNTAAAPKRLYQIREGAKLSGVCMGLAAYFNVDVTIVRILFVVLALLTSGAWLLAYIVMMFVIPVARTAEERAAAYGARFSAQELIDRAKKNYSDFKNNDEWRRHWRSQAYGWRDSMQRTGDRLTQGASYGAQVLAGIVVPLLGILNALIFVVLLMAIISLVTSNALFGWPLPQGLPLWLGVVLLIVVYNFLVWPLRALRHASYYAAGCRGQFWFAAWDGVLRLGLVAFALWFGYEHVPQVREFFDHFPQILDNVWRSIAAPRPAGVTV